MVILLDQVGLALSWGHGGVAGGEGAWFSQGRTVAQAEKTEKTENERQAFHSLVCFILLFKYQISPWKFPGKSAAIWPPRVKNWTKLDKMTPRSLKNQDHFRKGAQKSPKSGQFSHSAGSVAAAQKGGVLYFEDCECGLAWPALLSPVSHHVISTYNNNMG